MTSLLLQPCSVIAAVIGIMVYFACSDDEWEGSPEYLMTHAPMQTRAGVDVGGVDPVYKLKLDQCSTDSVSTGVYNVHNIPNFTAYVKFFWNTGYADEVIAAQKEHVNKPADTDTIKYRIIQTYFTNSPHFVYGSIGEDDVELEATLVIRYKKKYYNNNILIADSTKEASISVSTDVSDYAHWVKIINGTEYDL